jgi:hypothetical protein
METQNKSVNQMEFLNYNNIENVYKIKSIGYLKGIIKNMYSDSRKKLLFLILLSFIFFGCSSSSNSNESSTYNPPLWIQGTWGIKAINNGLGFDEEYYRFSTNNICQITIVNTYTFCWKDQIEQAPQGTLSGSDTSTDNTYEAKLISSNGGQTVTVKFQKISSTKIKLINSISDLVLEKLY